MQTIINFWAYSTELFKKPLSRFNVLKMLQFSPVYQQKMNSFLREKIWPTESAVSKK